MLRELVLSHDPLEQVVDLPPPSIKGAAVDESFFCWLFHFANLKESFNRKDVLFASVAYRHDRQRAGRFGDAGGVSRFS